MENLGTKMALAPEISTLKPNGEKIHWLLFEYLSFGMVHVLVMTVPTNYQPDSGHFFDFFQNRDVPKIIIFQKIVAQSIFGVEPFFFVCSIAWCWSTRWSNQNEHQTNTQRGRRARLSCKSEANAVIWRQDHTYRAKLPKNRELTNILLLFLRS